jgi:predicted Zn-dependent protease
MNIIFRYYVCILKNKQLMKLRIGIAGLFLLSVLALNAQQSRLADIYFNDGEFEKAAEVYKSLYEKNKGMSVYFQKYTECLISLRRFEEAEKALNSEIKTRPNDASLYVALGNMQTIMSDEVRGKKSFEEAVKRAGSDPNQIDMVARSFLSMGFNEYAAKVYENAQIKMGNSKYYAYSLAEIYRRIGDQDKMLTNYLLSVESFASNIGYLKTIFERYLSLDEIGLLQTKLYEFIQKEPEQIIFYELLEWTMLYQKQYKKALRQARSLDRQLNENGARVFNIATIAYNDKDYDTAIEGFQYITDQMAVSGSYYLDAKRSLLNAKREKVVGGYNYTKNDLLALRNEYLSFLQEYGRNSQTALLMIEYADFEALYMNNLSDAKNVLLEVISFGGVPPADIANAKLKLGDYYLIEEDRWESTLLYSQVDKSFKEGVLGEQARFRNARLSYFTGDFEWAQKQFDILKSATSRLISNDAIDLSVFIMDNLNLDTSAVPLQMYAKAELLVFQNKMNEALQMLDDVKLKYPDHALMDDLLYTKAQIYKKKQQPLVAAELYKEIIEKYPLEIRCDNALFDLAWLNETVFNDKEKAKELYFKIFTDYSSSTFAVDARKRYRLLRGDSL